MDYQKYVDGLEQEALRVKPEAGLPSLEMVLKGKAIELWSDLLGEVLWLVADEEDTSLLGQPRGSVYSAAEARRVCAITDPAVVEQVHAYKRKFNGVVREPGRGGKQ